MWETTYTRTERDSQKFRNDENIIINFAHEIIDHMLDYFIAVLIFASHHIRIHEIIQKHRFNRGKVELNSFNFTQLPSGHEFIYLFNR